MSNYLSPEWSCSSAEACVAAGVVPSKVRVWGARKILAATPRYDWVGVLKLCIVAEITRNRFPPGTAAQASQIDEALQEVGADLRAKHAPGNLVITRSFRPEQQAQPLLVEYIPRDRPLGTLFRENLDSAAVVVVDVAMIHGRALRRLKDAGVRVTP